MLQEVNKAKKKHKKTMCKQTRNNREKEFVKKEYIRTFGAEKLNWKFKNSIKLFKYRFNQIWESISELEGNIIKIPMSEK